MIERTGPNSLGEESVAAEAIDAPRRKTRRGKKKKMRYDSDDDSPETTLLSPNNVNDVLHGGVNVGEKEDVAVVSTTNSFVVPSSSSGGGCGGGIPYEIPDKTKVSREQNKNRTYSSRPCLLRPTDVPKAPENSTQFIIDDHEDCNLYYSFERRNNVSEDGEDCCTSPAFAGFRDIDYEYESPDDLVTSAFYEQDFENIYRHAREDELLSTPRNVIMQQYLDLERRVLDLEARLVPKVDPAAMIVQLQEELLKLQEENCALRTEKRSLLHGQDLEEPVDEENVADDSIVDDTVGEMLERVVDKLTVSEENDRTKCDETPQHMELVTSSE